MCATPSDNTAQLTTHKQSTNFDYKSTTKSNQTFTSFLILCFRWQSDHYKWLYFWFIPLDNRVTVTRKGEIAVKLNCANSFCVCQQSFECLQLVNHLKSLVNKKKVILFQTCWAKNLLLYGGSLGCSGVSHTWVCIAVSQYSVGQEAHSVR